MHAFVIDANAIKDFQTERVSGADGATLVQDCMEKIFNNGFIAVDDKLLILSEWYSCCSHSASEYSLEEWVLARIQEGKIKFKGIAKSTDKSLIAMSVSRKDHKYIILSCEVRAHSLVTNDIDFHDPAAKKKSAATKAKIKKSKAGPVCKHLRKCCGVNVVDWSELTI